MSNNPDAILLFSGGLDSLVAARLLEDQGLAVSCLHLVSPFFGSPENVDKWRALYDLDISVMDVSREAVALLAAYPAHGYGKNLNPCIDCKIMQMRVAKSVMEKSGATFIATGEVVGQRPMSQRHDVMNMIARQSGVEELLERPLCAGCFPATARQRAGLVDAGRFANISGRGRGEQLMLAEKFNIRPIPTPSGGCRLTEKENTRRYWQVLKKHWSCLLAATQNLASEDSPHLAPEALNELLARMPPDKWAHMLANLANLANDMRLANLGRQLWHYGNGTQYWLSIGRNRRDNEALLRLAAADDAVLSLEKMPGPIAIARHGRHWPEEMLRQAAALTAACSNRALALETMIPMRCQGIDRQESFLVKPGAHAPDWTLPDWETVRAEIRQIAKNRNQKHVKGIEGDADNA